MLHERLALRGAGAGDPADVLAALERGGPEAAARALVGAAFHHSDRQAVQGLCLRLVDGEDRALAAVAAICLGHLARVHRQLDTGTVRAALDRQRGDPLVGPRAEDALDDLDTYLRTRPNPNGATDTREPIRLRSKTCRRPFGW